MKKAIQSFLLLTTLLQACTPPDASIEKNFQLAPTQTLTLATPASREILIGDQLDLAGLVRVSDASNQLVAVPSQSLRFFANEQPNNANTFQATKAGTYVFKVQIGNRTSNTFTVTVLPYTLVRIPVVFHTVNSTLTAAQISRMVQGMTDAFRNRWNPFNGAQDENAVDNFIEFYAAPTSPTGQALAVPGLDAVSATRQTFTSQQAVGEAWNSYWHPNRFLNVWVYDIAKDESLSGFAYNLPVTRTLAGLRSQSASRTSPDLPYGIYLNKTEVSDTRSATLAHEAGHVLGLKHVFDGNGEEYQSCSATDPDYCADTPAYDRNTYIDNYRTLRQRRTACDGTSFVSTNIMDYYLGYENSITRNQRDRIQHVISYGLWLPSPANDASRSRENAEANYIEKPDDYRFVEPLICQ